MDGTVDCLYQSEFSSKCEKVRISTYCSLSCQMLMLRNAQFSLNCTSWFWITYFFMKLQSEKEVLHWPEISYLTFDPLEYFSQLKIIFCLSIITYISPHTHRLVQRVWQQLPKKRNTVFIMLHQINVNNCIIWFRSWKFKKEMLKG